MSGHIWVCSCGETWVDSVKAGFIVYVECPVCGDKKKWKKDEPYPLRVDAIDPSGQAEGK